MPGQAKIVSMITATLSMTTKLMPARVRARISAFLKRLTITTRSGVPLRRASLTYSRRARPAC